MTEGRPRCYCAIDRNPKQPVLDWLRPVDPTSAEMTIEDLRKEPTVCLLAESHSDEFAEKLLAKSGARIFEEQLDGWYR